MSSSTQFVRCTVVCSEAVSELLSCTEFTWVNLEYDSSDRVSGCSELKLSLRLLVAPLH